MQNNEHSESNRFRKFLQEKGYYIVLFLCILAVGISGYLFVSGAVSEKKSLNEQTLSVATSAEIPEDKSSSSGSKPQQGGKHRRRSPRPAPLPGPRTRRTPPRRRLPPKRSQSASGLSRASASRPTACRSFPSTLPRRTGAHTTASILPHWRESLSAPPAPAPSPQSTTMNF